MISAIDTTYILLKPSETVTVIIEDDNALEGGTTTPKPYKPPFNHPSHLYPTPHINHYIIRQASSPPSSWLCSCV